MSYFYLYFQFAVDFTEKTLSKALMGRLLSESAGDTELPTLSVILQEEILQVDQQLVDIQTTAEELSGDDSILGFQFRYNIDTTLYNILQY